MFRISLLVILLTMISNVSAHHSMAEFDFDTIQELQGEVTHLSWRNPHVEITLSVSEADGSETLWEFEGQDINTMSRRGLTAELLSVGDQVRAAGHPSQRRAHIMSVTNLLLPNGTELRFRGNPEPRWASENSLGFGSVGLAPDLDDDDLAAAKSLGLFRVWMRVRSGGFPAELPLTDTALSHRENWTEADDPNTNCTVPGMPSSMRISPPHPIEILEREDGNITVHVEFFDVFRTVYMDANLDPATLPASAQGVSIGRWDGNALVVETTKVDWPNFDNMAKIPQSESVSIFERFDLGEDATQMTYEITVTDSSTFTEPVKGSWLMNWHPNMEMQEYDCIPPQED